jgi:hypothetical protein
MVHAQGPNNIFGYAVTVNDGLYLSGYNDNNNQSIINPNPGSLKLITNVQTQFLTTTFNEADAYTTAILV